MSKKLTPKQQLQADYKLKFGEDPNTKMTVSELEKALSANSDEATQEDSIKGKSTKMWVSDPDLLIRVEGTKETIPVKNKKGIVEGGKQYLGYLK